MILLEVKVNNYSRIDTFKLSLRWLHNSLRCARDECSSSCVGWDFKFRYPVLFLFIFVFVDEILLIIIINNFD